MFASKTFRTASSCLRLTTNPGFTSRSFATRIPSKPASRRRADLLLIVAGAGVCGGVGATLWYSSSSQHPQGQGTFTVQTPGNKESKTLAMLTPEQVENLLKADEHTFQVSRPGNPVHRWDTASLSSNSPIEDDRSFAIVERDSLPASLSNTSEVRNSNGDICLWSVMDGHSGWRTSKLLSDRLLAYVARELGQAIAGESSYTGVHLQSLQENAFKNTMDKLWNALGGGTSKPNPALLELDENPAVVEAALKNAFRKLDDEICNTPLRLLDQLQTDPEATSITSKLTPSRRNLIEQGREALLPALSGSCALVTYLDTLRQRLYVAVTGDSRAVMGTYDQGKWKMDVLSDDLTAENPKEIARVKKEHLSSEADTVISRGRILGSLQPSRAFGDARYKWPLGIQERLQTAFNLKIRGSPRHYSTPPYVTAEPEVTSLPMNRPTSVPVSQRHQRFIVMATDGLYDQLSNEEIVGLVGGWLEGIEGPQDSNAVLSKVTKPGTSLFGTGTTTHRPRGATNKTFAFEDKNLATHLIRNALGGAEKDQLTALLSIPAGMSRKYRDDITVTVILLASDPEGENGIQGLQKVEPSRSFRAKL